MLAPEPRLGKSGRVGPQVCSWLSRQFLVPVPKFPGPAPGWSQKLPGPPANLWGQPKQFLGPIANLWRWPWGPSRSYFSSQGKASGQNHSFFFSSLNLANPATGIQSHPKNERAGGVRGDRVLRPNLYDFRVKPGAGFGISGRISGEPHPPLWLTNVRKFR